MMDMTVMYEDTPVTEVYVSNDKKQINIKKLVPDSLRQPFGGNRNDLARVYDFLKSRCYEDGRADLPEILRQAGMEQNNPWQWVQKTHGATFEDCFWIRFPGETLTWKDVKLR